MTAPLITARSLVKRFGDLVAVDGIDVDVQEGEAFGFLGPNGAGKTSTMRMIGCVSPVTSGRLEIFGMDPSRDGRAIRARVGVVPQADQLDNELTVMENLVIYARYFDIPRTVARRRAAELLDFVQLTERADDTVDPLSGGQKRRLDRLAESPETAADKRQQRCCFPVGENLAEPRHLPVVDLARDFHPPPEPVQDDLDQPFTRARDPGCAFERRSLSDSLSVVLVASRAVGREQPFAGIAVGYAYTPNRGHAAGKQHGCAKNRRVVKSAPSSHRSVKETRPGVVGFRPAHGLRPLAARRRTVAPRFTRIACRRGRPVLSLSCGSGREGMIKPAAKKAPRRLKEVRLKWCFRTKVRREPFNL